MARYQALVEKGSAQLDLAQMALITQLDALLVQVEQGKRSSSQGWLDRLLRRKGQASGQINGLYIYGSVGRGKTMLMDLFFDCLSTVDKKRAHFNDFMNDVQDRLHHQRKRLREGKSKNTDPIPPIAADLARSARILCFDEFSVTDIADAMILGRLFSALFDEGVLLVATSNVAPDALYQNGLNRALFLPFIDILKNHVEIFNLDSLTDYRLTKSHDHHSYFSPLDETAKAQMDTAWQAATNNAAALPATLTLRGHLIAIPAAIAGAARFDFCDLCTRPLGSYDYLALVKDYHSFFIDNVPLFDNSTRNEAKRFILLVDTLYEARARIVISAAAMPDKLYQAGITTTESFEFDRTASRLFEMQSVTYLEEWSQKNGVNVGK